MLPQIHSYDSWTQLEEVWLGDVYPASFYEHLEPEVRDVFQHITEITQQDLASIQCTIESFGVKVRRPVYESLDRYVHPDTGHLIKPQICPRDMHVTLGTTLYLAQQPINQDPWRHALESYKQCPYSTIKNNANGWFNGANSVRMGKNLLVDLVYAKNLPEYQLSLEEFSNYNVKLVDNGGHMDACFAILKPGLILANNYFQDYDETFPGWQRIHLNQSTYHADRKNPRPGPMHNGKFWQLDTPTNKAFNNHVIKHALDWVGTYTETYFELNCLVINETNVIMQGYSQALEQELATHGIKVHWVPFRTRTFWDGGMHCLTLDIRRQGTFKDYF